MTGGRPPQRRGLWRRNLHKVLLQTPHISTLKKESLGKQAHKMCAVSGGVVLAYMRLHHGPPFPGPSKHAPVWWLTYEATGRRWLPLAACVSQLAALLKLARADASTAIASSTDSQGLLHGGENLVWKRKPWWIQNQKILLLLNDCKHSLNSLGFLLRSMCADITSAILLRRVFILPDALPCWFLTQLLEGKMMAWQRWLLKSPFPTPSSLQVMLMKYLALCWTPAAGTQ